MPIFSAFQIQTLLHNLKGVPGLLRVFLPVKLKTNLQNVREAVPGEHALNDVRPVEAVDAVRAEDALLLRDLLNKTKRTLWWSPGRAPRPHSILTRVVSFTIIMTPCCSWSWAKRSVRILSRSQRIFAHSAWKSNASYLENANLFIIYYINLFNFQLLFPSFSV